jgi:hypothetical protein
MAKQRPPAAVGRLVVGGVTGEPGASQPASRSPTTGERSQSPLHLPGARFHASPPAIKSRSSYAAIPSTRTTSSRDVWPRTMLTRRTGTQAHRGNEAHSAAFAAPSTGGAVARISRPPSRAPASRRLANAGSRAPRSQPCQERAGSASQLSLSRGSDTPVARRHSPAEECRFPMDASASSEPGRTFGGRPERERASSRRRRPRSSDSGSCPVGTLLATPYRLRRSDAPRGR